MLGEVDEGDRLRVGWLWEGCRKSRRCSRDTYPESYITKYTSIRRSTYSVKLTRDDLLGEVDEGLGALAGRERRLARELCVVVEPLQACCISHNVLIKWFL